jgi:IgGFc binding protein
VDPSRLSLSPRALLGTAALAAGLVLPLACGGAGQATGGHGGRPASAASSTATGGSGGGSGCLLGALCDGGAPDGSGQYGCSADLRSVVDSHGDVVMTCPSDEGCSGGACIAACAAAAASKGNVGCDFLVPTPPSYPPDLPPCFAVFVANAWPAPAALTVSFNGMSYDVTQFGFIPQDGMPEPQWPAVAATGIPAGQVAVLFLSGDPNSIFTETGEPMKCPVPTAVAAATSLQDSGKNSAFHITSSVPVSAYDILPYGGAHTHFPGATLLMPTSAWGDNYVMIATPPGTATPAGPLWGQIVATQDSTTVELLPSVDLPAADVFPAAPAGQTATITLSAGEYLEWELVSGSNDMSGTIVSSDKPVAAFAGNRFFRLQPMSEPGGEEAHGQIPPVSALGSEYVAAPYATRRADLAPEAISYRFVGVVDGTQLVYDPPVATAPATLDRAQVADFIVTGAFHAQSQDAMHPFATAQIMPTANLPGGSRPGATAPTYPPLLGDEEFVVMLPPAQFLAKYVFFTDPTYPTTNLVLTRGKGATGFQPVTVDCLGAVTGWTPVGTSGQYEVTNVDLLRAGIASGTCTNGGHTAESTAPFGLVVWGEDSYSSYAYPGGGNAAQLTTVTVPATPK